MNWLNGHDVPNWASALIFALAYMYGIIGEKLENTRRDEWARMHDSDHI